MEQFFKNPQTLLSMREGPLGTYIDSFAKQLTDQGYARYSARLQLRLVADFNLWLKQQGVTVSEITPEHIKHYLQYRGEQQRPRSGDAAPLKRLLDILRQDGAIAEKEAPFRKTPAQQLADEFGLYLRQERALAAATVAYYLEFVSRFLIDRFSDGEAELAVLCAADVVRFVQCQAARLHPKRAKLMTTALRSFLQYARYRGDLNIDLAASVPTVANWSMASIPRSLPVDQVELILAHCDRQTTTGRRDYAILLLLARLGLRAGEVASLTLDDIDWDAGYITVRGKGGQWSQLPLPIDVGEAIALYLQNGRPPTTSRRVFMRVKAPVADFQGQQAVGSVVRHALIRAGIDAPHKGAHLFRHTLATGMLAQGASLAEIGELLRHRSPQTTTIYAKVDLTSLRTLALPWPGGEQ
jgi:integrase/recombinase XerD